jgi:ferric-dicitrate binding protein FerR (iron transport regulator)
MSKLEYTVEDFVLDSEFRKWVLSPDGTTKAYWEEYLKKNPSKYRDIKLARNLLLNIARKSHQVNDARIETTWQNIEETVQQMEKGTLERRVIPLNSLSTLKKHEPEYRPYSENHQFYRIAGILLLAFALAIAANILLPQEHTYIVEAPVIYEEHYAPPGVKSNLTLQDGSKVILNSGSSLRYIKNFEEDQRELVLIGEAYFEVAKDSLRPFMVRTGSITTRALGTSFNIKAYKNEAWDISLLTGLVEVDVSMDHQEKVNLVPGEALNINLDKQQFQKRAFEEEKLMAWTQKTIIFDHAPIAEITRVLENWYGVKIKFTNRPNKDLIVSGVFRDQTLENVLEGLSYSARFEFDIDKDQVTLTFK